MKIMVSPAMWAIIIGHVCFNFGHYAIMTKLPAYMKEVLHMDIKSVSITSWFFSKHMTFHFCSIMSAAPV